MTLEQLGSLGIAAAGILTAIFGYLTSKRANQAQHETDTAKLEAASVETAASEWRTLYNQLKQDLEELRRRVDASEAREYRMKRDLDEVWTWIDSGATPPPPMRPDYVRQAWEDTITQPTQRNTP